MPFTNVVRARGSLAKASFGVPLQATVNLRRRFSKWQSADNGSSKALNFSV